MRKIVFELCAETIDACLAAAAGGADRIELCSGLSEGGVTPSHALIREAVRSSGLPVHVLLRPRSGDFVYSDAEFQVMQEDLRHMMDLGAAGVALGLLHTDGTVDIERTRQLVHAAGPLEVTFHRAFDGAVPLNRALEDVIATGCRRVLTSGGAIDVGSGAASLQRLVRQAGERIDVAVGGGLRLGNATEIAQRTGATHFHGSVRRNGTTDGSLSTMGPERPSVEAEDIRNMIASLAHA